MIQPSRYFRLSLTNECNLACYFCHNEGQGAHLRQGLQLEAADFIWACSVARDSGFTKFKLTGGEPTLRPDLLEIIAGIRDTGIDDLSMITNGVSLSRLAGKLRAAGLPRLNVSLFTLNEQRFTADNGGTTRTLGLVTAGIDAAIAVGYTDLKLNYVWHQSRDLGDFLRVAEFAAARKLTIAVLPLLHAFGTQPTDEFTALGDVYRTLEQLGIEAEHPVIDAEGVRRRLIRLAGGATVLLRMDELGQLAPYPECARCPKRPECREGIFPVRLSAHGTLRACLSEGVHPVSLYAAIRTRQADVLRAAFAAIPHSRPQIGGHLHAGAA